MNRYHGLKRIAALCMGLGAAGPALAHHGIAGLGAAGLAGPGATLESATSSVLPRGSTLLYGKLDYSRFETFEPDPLEPEGLYSNYMMLGIGHGFRSWLSGYLFLPYHIKADEPGGFDTSGFADISLFGQIGLKYDQGLALIPENESLDDLEDWHFTVFGGLTVPTGEPNLRDAQGEIDPGKSTGFGKPSFSAGLTATKMLSARWTLNWELSGVWFQEYRYEDGARTRFGTETRLNTALIYRAHTDPERLRRVDTVLEVQYLDLGRDRADGIGEEATGGSMVYLAPGVRLSIDRVSLAAGVKFPTWTNLNEESFQQGAEGKEDYRLILSASWLF
jgi:hypothetical protein